MSETQHCTYISIHIISTLMSNTEIHLSWTSSPLYHHKNVKKNKNKIQHILNALYQHCKRIPCLQLVWKSKAIGNWIYWAFPKSFSTRSMPLSHVGRLSFITWDQCTAWWMACACRHSGALNISVWVFWDSSCWHPPINKNKNKCRVCIVSEKMLQSCESMNWGGGKRWGLLKGEAVPQSVLCGNLLKRSTDGWEGNLNVISRGLQLDPKKIQCFSNSEDL